MRPRSSSALPSALSPRPAVARLSPGCPAAAAVRCRLMRGCLLALLLLMALGLESWPDSCLALGFALARGVGFESWPDSRLALGFALGRGVRL